MKTRIWLANQGTLNLLGRTFVVLCVALGVVSAWWAAKFLMASAEARAAEVAAGSHEAGIDEAKKLLASAGRIDPSSTPAGLAVVSAFQSAIESSAAEHGCNLTDFTASPEMLPFLSRFETGTEQSEWSQVQVQLRLRGGIRSIMTTLRAVTAGDVAYEFSSIEFSRVSAPKSGEAVVEAAVDLRVLTKVPGASV